MLPLHFFLSASSLLRKQAFLTAHIATTKEGAEALYKPVCAEISLGSTSFIFSKLRQSQNLVHNRTKQWTHRTE